MLLITVAVLSWISLHVVIGADSDNSINLPSDNSTSSSSHENNLSLVNIGKCPGSKITQNELRIPSWLKLKGHNATLVFRLANLEPGLEKTCPGGKVASVTVTKRIKNGNMVQFLDGGMVSINHAHYDTDQYCFSRFDTKSVTLSHCDLSCSPSGPVLCIPKCCPLTEIMKLDEDGLTQSCVPSGPVKWTPRVYSSRDDPSGVEAKPLLPKDRKPLHYKFTEVAGTLIPITYRAVNFSEGGEEVEPFHASPFRLLDNGSMIILVLEPENGDGSECGEVIHRYPIHNKFCVDGFIVGDDAVYDGSEIDQIAFLPWVTEEDENTTNTIIKASFVLLGIIFLVLTILMHLVIWPKHNIHGWTVFSFVVSMLVFFITLATVHITHLTSTRVVLGTGSCLLVAILGHFTFLCALCWMSIMNFDFWTTFRILSPSQEHSKSVQRYARYLVFAVGVPSIIVGISVVLHFTLGEEYHENHNGFLPGYGTTKCQLHPCSQKYYLYIPMAFLLGFNLIMFSWTVFTLWTYKKKTQATSGQKHWILFCKLFLCMGISWIFEVLSGFLNWDFVLLDIINLLQAVAIFFIFTAKRENLLWIYKRYRCSKRFIAPILRTRCCYVAELDVEQTEMTSAEKNRTLVTFKARGSGSSENY
ncbi:uncharacterized protein LOC110853224 isoform X2 [Folsomia candida]|uniref:uncharacterized protein LOC110853224 isoform X2 n=1 Tax=Folsomia candida TaxID=158441 RepID=UPI000B8FE35D|nr:uncharacterized protein LOC110853224 isoform X2 [Folsomia candida]